jgi:uncharacterized membrane-anchored protein YjiN (DUF445 family)
MSASDLDRSDRAAARELARRKAFATGLVVLCAAVFVASHSFADRHPALPYVAAFAEAAIIGALADWYAVVALFRHPLGLPLPHTAIIPANQSRIAEAIGSFIAHNFLAGSRVGAKLEELDPADGIGRWLGEPQNRARIAAHLAHLLPDAVAALDTKMLHGKLERGILDRLATIDVGRALGGSLELLTRNGRHRVLLDELLARLEAWLGEPTAIAALREQLRRELPSLFRLFSADAYLMQRLIGVTHKLLKDVREDPDHPLRGEFDRFFGDFIEQLRESPAYQERLDAMKHELLARAPIRDVLTQGWDRLIAFLRSDVDRADGVIRLGLSSFLADLAERLRTDEALRGTVNRWLAEAAATVTERNKHEVGAFVAAQVKSWDTRRAVRAIELSLGKDLQFIRVNGTIVGGLLGLALHVAKEWLWP